MYNKLSMRMVLCLIVIMIIPLAFAEGLTVKSVSYFPYNGNNNVTINFVVNDGGQSLSGIWYGEGLPDGKRLEQPIKIEVKNREEKIIYHFLNQGALYKYQAYYKDAPDRWSGAVCENKPAWCFPIDTDRIGVGLDRVLIIQRVASGSYARFSNPDVSESVDIVITINGTDYKQTVGSGQTSRGSEQFRTQSGEYIGRASWTGFTLTGKSYPNQNNYVATHVTPEWKGQVSTWLIAPMTSYETYIKSVTEVDTQLSLLSAKLPDGFDEEGRILKANYELPTMCKDKFCKDVINLYVLHNANVDKLTNTSVQIDYRAPTSTLVTEVNEGNVIDTLNRPIGNSEIVLVLNADRIRVIQTSGKPYIDNISMSPCTYGDNDCYFNIRIKNIGDDSATFAVRTNGSAEQKITLDSGAYGQVKLPFIGQEGLNSGLIEVYDIVTGESATQVFEVNVNVSKNFIPNDTQIYNNVPITSDATGMNQTAGKECIGIWQYNQGKYSCLEFDNIKEPAKVTKEQLFMAVPTATPEPPKEGISNLWIVTVIIIMVLIGVIAGQWMMSGGRSKKGNRALTLLLVAIVIGAVLIVAVLYGDALIAKVNEMKFVMNIMEKLR